MDRSKILKEALFKAGDIIMSANPSEGAHEKEGRGNFVTAADLACEKKIIDLIYKHFPIDKILSEETHSQLENILEADHLWVIDPIDGTNNFRYGRHYSCSSVAYVEKGQTLLAGVYNPYIKELFFAQKNQGAYLNGIKIAVGTTQTDIHKSFLASDNSNNAEGTKRNLEMILKIQPSPTVYIKGSAVLTMCELAAGRYDLYFHTTLKPWDAAAAFLIVQEAGGVVKNLDGNNAHFTSQSAIVGNNTLVDQCLKLFNS